MSTPDPTRARVACLLAAGFLTLPATADDRGPLSLTPGAAVERRLGAGESHLFRAELGVGEPWLVRVEQRGVDVIVEVTDPRGRSLLAVDSPRGREGTESLLLTPEVAGAYAVEVRCEKRGAPEGRYEIRLEALGADTPAERLRAEQALSEAGRRYAEDGKDGGDAAVAKVREALEAWRALGDRRREAETLVLLGAHLDRREERLEAVTAYGRALDLWRRLGDPGGTAAALERLGVAHRHLGENPRAIRYLEEALEMRRSLGQRGREAGTRNQLCLVLQRSGRFRAAGDCYEETLSLAEELGDTALVATVLNNLGGVHQNLGEPAKQVDDLRRALELQRAVGDAHGEAAALNNLGAFHRRLGEVEEALRHFGQALEIFERLGDRSWQARVLNNAGVTYLNLGEPERARAYLLRALELRRQVDDRPGESVTLLNLGLAFSGLGETGKAVAFTTRALENGLAAGDRRGVATARRLLGGLHVDRGELEAARRQLEPALASLREMGSRREEAAVLVLLGRAHLAAGEVQEARASAGQALERYRAVRDPVGEVRARTVLARVERTLGRDDAVRAHLEDALEGLESLHARLGDPAQKASFLATQRQVHELYVDFLMALHRRQPSRGHDLAALEASERARSRSLLGVLETGGADRGRGIEPALADRLRAAERRFAAKTRRQLAVLGRDDGGEEALRADQELYAALAELESVRAEIRRRHPRHASLARPRILDAAALRGLLDDDTVLLEIFLGEERSFLWWVTPASVTAHELPPREAIEELAERVHRQVSAIHQRGGAAREALDALGRMLLGPVADRLEDQRLVVVADGALHFVPFAALTLPRSRQPVVTRHEVAYLPSASVLAAQRRALADAATRPAAKTVAIFADPIFDRRDPRLGEDVAVDGSRRPSENELAGRPEAVRLGLDGLDRLPHTRLEAEAIAALVPPSERLLVTGAEARRSRVVGGELDAYRILHFATHGLVNPRAPELSGVVLSRLAADGSELDGFLGPYDVASLELAAELVVLSGCRTALGRQIRGEGLVGLTRGFLHAGVPRVVASFWQVRDQATAELMARFYRALLVDGLPPAAALRAAQLSLRQERRWRDPFYWAAFALQGDWR